MLERLEVVLKGWVGESALNGNHVVLPRKCVEIIIIIIIIIIIKEHD